MLNPVVSCVVYADRVAAASPMYFTPAFLKKGILADMFHWWPGPL